MVLMGVKNKVLKRIGECASPPRRAGLHPDSYRDFHAIKSHRSCRTATTRLPYACGILYLLDILNMKIYGQKSD